MKSEVVIRENYRDYEILVRKLSYDKESNVSWIPNTWYCGYVVIPANDKFYNASEDLLDTLDVHGGISFTGYLDEVGDAFLLGFDCNHARDDIHEQDIFYVERECKSLIDQIIELNKEYKVSFNIFMRDKKSKDEVEKMIEQALSETIGKDNTVFAFNIEVE